MPSLPLWRAYRRAKHSPESEDRHRRPVVPHRVVVTLGMALVLAATATVLLPGTGQRVPAPDQGLGNRIASGAGGDDRVEPSRYPWAGVGSFTVAGGHSPVHGEDGPVARYRVAVEQGTGQNPAAFAAAVDKVLADPRSWIGTGQLSVQRIEEAESADFTIYLATPRTSEVMCAEGGLSTEGYTSCRLPGQVVINLARWLEAVPDYGAPLEVYQAYVINHEVGHEFGEGHEACPAPGDPAPVMQQQTYGLDGCLPNAWPILDGHRYAGELDG
jgi:hypothetical protein